MLKWNDSMTTGVAVIDGQHKEMIEKYNAFEQALSSGIETAKQKEEAENMLDFLQFYALWHFKREEAAFEKYNCPAADENKAAHTEFIEKFGQFYEAWQTQGMDVELMQKTFKELGDWVANHILGVDIKLHACVKAAAEQQSK